MTQNSTQSDSESAKKVLLADDDLSLRRYLEVVLRRAGYQIIAAEDGAMAMQKAFESSFDIAVLDAVMPNLTGYELCRILKQHPDFQHLPVVILSGLEVETSAGADAYLMKTAHLQEELLSVIEELLGASTKKSSTVESA